MKKNPDTKKPTIFRRGMKIFYSFTFFIPGIETSYEFTALSPLKHNLTVASKGKTNNQFGKCCFTYLPTLTTIL